MKLTIKQLIAREGLIILVILILSLITFALPNSWVIKDKDIPIDRGKQAKLKITDTKNGTIYTVIVDRKYVEEKADGFNYTKADILKELGERGGLESVKDLNIVKKEINLSSVKKTALTILMLAYPIYLVARFIIWAIKTLQKKEASSIG